MVVLSLLLLLMLKCSGDCLTKATYQIEDGELYGDVNSRLCDTTKHPQHSCINNVNEISAGF